MVIKMKRKLFAAALLAICLAVSAWGSLAYYTAEGTAHNVITSGSVDIRLLEWADRERTKPFPDSAVGGVMPGQGVVKIVEIENVGKRAAYVRVGVKERIKLSGGGEAVGGPELISADYDSGSWTYSQGYYYYNAALQPGETTAPLFSTLSFDGRMGNAYQNSEVSVEVLAYATQAENNGVSALEAGGWPAA